MSIFEKFKKGFKKSAENISSGFREILVKKEIDDNSLDKIEEFLISSDVGIDAASEIRNILSQEKIDPDLDLVKEINKILKNYITSNMRALEKKDFFKSSTNLNVTLVAGVNGSGKTTTIGKIAKIFKENNNKVILSASDTFRAAAIEQLENWANKIGVNLIKSHQGSDPASVAYKAMDFAKQNKFNQLIIDTAGRLQNKKNLMEEYKKIINVLKKIDGKFPNEVILVLDATTGQNALNQVEEFSKIHDLTGLIITKLDSTAKGGIVLAICKKFNLPIVAIGMGEKEDYRLPAKSSNADCYLSGVML